MSFSASQRCVTRGSLSVAPNECNGGDRWISSSSTGRPECQMHHSHGSRSLSQCVYEKTFYSTIVGTLLAASISTGCTSGASTLAEQWNKTDHYLRHVAIYQNTQVTRRGRTRIHQLRRAPPSGQFTSHQTSIVFILCLSLDIRVYAYSFL